MIILCSLYNPVTSARLPIAALLFSMCVNNSTYKTQVAYSQKHEYILNLILIYNTSRDSLCAHLTTEQIEDSVVAVIRVENCWNAEVNTDDEILLIRPEGVNTSFWTVLTLQQQD